MSPAIPPDLSRPLRDAMAPSLRALHAAGAAEPPLRVPCAAVAIGPGRLARAAASPAAGRATLEALYRRCLLRYREAVADEQPAAGADDLGAVLANFVAANLHALHGTRPPAEALRALAQQLAGIVRGSAVWRTAPLRERQAYTEQLAILAVLMVDLAAIAPRQGPDAVAELQGRARGYLRQLLGLDPDALTLDVSGLALRQEPVAA